MEHQRLSIAIGDAQTRYLDHFIELRPNDGLKHYNRGSGAMRGMVLLIAGTLAIANCAGNSEHATPAEQPDETDPDDDTALAALRAREVARDVAAILEGMKFARLRRLATLGLKP